MKIVEKWFYTNMRQSQDETKYRFVTVLPKRLLTLWIQAR